MENYYPEDADRDCGGSLPALIGEIRGDYVPVCQMDDNEPEWVWVHRSEIDPDEFCS